ncbi:MAG: hypothetical protein ACTHKB_00765 [Burkholderiaceae bacterium]
MKHETHVKRALTELRDSYKLNDAQLHVVAGYVSRLPEGDIKAARQRGLSREEYEAHYQPAPK